jgi:hypothetical protein
MLRDWLCATICAAAYKKALGANMFLGAGIPK